ncbi:MULTISPECIES: cell division protein FtsZ [Flavobacterium]|uniref:Cell division protein FtsZ n=1 Tax=Flavobacterium covae TaxID=2906076 RepID=A0ABW8PCT9_9FLAO|nr:MULTISPECIES: cell division protein FtsZ [Flavobacterium]OXA83590.1 cell division protein FtsZ [Flavobacterium columnare] [Flavobacterium columnare NBRC 100251 = ATCC 23463]AMA50019.1 cell division protein FtsZ [Flavobacterium covae]AND64451.1 cell division protein FtsZ [Flavobacterium covae]MCJ1805569.1 cell division protein FtsZ [Flavobacterium covae]MCJ1808668.1 cell division protein FtsZ [Flavobacterium covae]
MESNSGFGSISFDLPKTQTNVIKVIGVGGGGSNAINHMYKQGIKGVDFIVCNTDSQALQNSNVPHRIQLGANLTEGLGAGANPEVGHQAALESIEDIEKMLDTNTKMVFITAGMGGGTGTGAAPVIAQLAKEKDILTVGIVTIPFQFEGKVRSEQALLGVEKLRKQVDSLIVINNNKLREVYGNLGFKAGFSKADEVLATASRGIAEVITHHYTQNIDLKDAKTVLSNSGTAIMGSATAEGEHRAKEAIVAALDSPLLNDNKITGAKNVLLLIVSGANEITIDEIGEINDYIQEEAGYNANIIMGVGEDEELGDKISVTVIATGFCIEQQAGFVNTEPKKIIHALEDEQKLVQNLTQKFEAQGFDFNTIITPTEPVVSVPPVTPIPPVDSRIVYNLEDETPNNPISTASLEVDFQEPVVHQTAVNNAVMSGLDLVPTSEFIKNLNVTFEIVPPKEIVANEFFITTPEVKAMEVVAPEVISVSNPMAFTFDLPVARKEAITPEKNVFELTDEIKDIKVNQAVQLVPMTEVSQDGIIRHSLEEYMENENPFFQTKKTEPVVEKIPEELNITIKQTEETVVEQNYGLSSNEISPVEMSIEESLRLRAEERRRKMKEFNYKFHNNASRVEEYEKVPAYKRMGLDVTNNPIQNNQSRMSLGLDNNDEIQLRSNNSFLHDNVD